MRLRGGAAGGSGDIFDEHGDLDSAVAAAEDAVDEEAPPDEPSVALPRRARERKPPRRERATREDSRAVVAFGRFPQAVIVSGVASGVAALLAAVAVAIALQGRPPDGAAPVAAVTSATVPTPSAISVREPSAERGARGADRSPRPAVRVGERRSRVPRVRSGLRRARPPRRPARRRAAVSSASVSPRRVPAAVSPVAPARSWSSASWSPPSAAPSPTVAANREFSIER